MAFLESIAFSLADGVDALLEDKAKLKNLIFIGGGSKSDFFAQLIANVLNISIDTCLSSAYAPSIGAARLARLATKKESEEDVIVALPVTKTFRVDQAMHTKYAEKLKQFRVLYELLRN